MKFTFENELAVIAKKADRMQALREEVRDKLQARDRLEGHVKYLQATCEQKQQGIEQLRDVVAKEAEKLHALLQEARQKRFNVTFERLNVCSGAVVSVAEQLDRLEQITPEIFNDHVMREQLDGQKEKLRALERELHQRRTNAKRTAKTALAEYRSVVEQVHLAMDLEWELTELRRREEEEESLVENRNANLEKKNEELRRRFEESTKYRNAKKF